MEHEETVTIAAPVEKVWAVLADVERWPEWTASMTTVAPQGDAPLAVGSQVRIKQPGFPAVVWTVDEWQPPDRFSWSASSPGVHTVADHELTPSPADDPDPAGPPTTTVTLRIRQTGPLAWLLTLLTSRRTRRYVAMEAQGLKTRSEA
jgi:uncharacterized protein YndB with AHSA1/START domain